LAERSCPSSRSRFDFRQPFTTTTLAAITISGIKLWRLQILTNFRSFRFVTTKFRHNKTETQTMTTKLKQLSWTSAALFLALATIFLPIQSAAQDNPQDDPPTRVARLGYLDGSVSFQPAGTTDWVGAVPNRPMTTGDQLWSDVASRAELQLGSAVIRLGENTGISFLNLDDHTVQIQLSSGAINIRVRQLDPNDDFEIDTPNLAFTITQPGRYRVDASADGTYTIVSLRDGNGQATGSGQTYDLYAGQQATFSGTDSLYADVETLGDPDAFDSWAYGRDARYDQSRSALYLSRDVVGFEDLDQYGQWGDDGTYGHVWYPSQVAVGWAPYHSGHWDWIPPWGYTWVDDSPWGYAPFHYGRWVFVGGRWGWIAGPVNVRPVYAPALVVFIGGGPGGWGGNVGWFPLGPREVYVPPYQVSRGYMTQVNVSNTVVNTTVITNVYNTTIINKTTNITNITYANRSVQGAVTVVPQGAFAGAQPVAKVAVTMNAQQLASAPVAARVAVVPTRQAVLGAKAATAGRVKAPPAAVMSRQVVAKKTPPPPPVPFAKQQQALAANPGQPVPRSQLQALRPAAASRPMVKQAPPGKPATPTTGHPNPAIARPGQPANQPPNRPNQPTNQPASQPMNRPNQPASNRPAPSQPAPNQPAQNRPVPNQPAPVRPTQPTTRPENNPPQNKPAQENRPENNRPENNNNQMNRPTPPAQQNRPPATQPNRPETNRPEPNRTEPAAKPAVPPAEHPQPRTPPPAANNPAPEQKTPAQKKQEEEEKKKQEKPPGQ
jgi:hypothetical protein